MQRWGSHQPFWNYNIKRRFHEPLRQDLTVDAVVVGAGITGMVTAVLLQEGGLSVAVVTDGEVGQGTTGYSSGHLTQVQDYPMKDLIARFGQAATYKVMQSNKEAIYLVEQLCRRYDIESDFVYVPGIKYTENKEGLEELTNDLELSRNLGMPVKVLKKNPLPFLVAGGILFDRQAMFNPLKFVLGLAESFCSRKGYLFEKSRALEFEDGNPAKIHTAFGSITAKHVILATHTPVGTYFSLHTRVAPYFSYVMGVQTKKPAKLSALYWDTTHPYYYLRPSSPGSSFWIIGGRDHKTGQETNPMEKYIELEEFIDQRFDREEISCYWGNELFAPVDDLPYIGKIPFTQNFYTATGFSGNGLTYGPLAGLILRDLVTGHQNEYTNLYDPSRIKPMASASTFLKENINVAKWLMSDPIGRQQIGEVKNIPPNEGRIVEVESKKLAVFRNERGGIHVLSATCTHMGCTVHWNSAEKSWDCPCHGGRYHPTGEVFEGPPLKDLEDIKLYTEENPDVEEIQSPCPPGFSPMPN